MYKINSNINQHFPNNNCMIQIHKTKKGTDYIYATDLYKSLEISATSFKMWLKESINLGFKESQDYYFLKGNNSVTDCALHIEMAKHISLVQNTNKGRMLRQYLISLANKRSKGELLNTKQIIALLEIVKVLGYFSVQKKLEREHYKFYGKPMEWWSYRAKLLGYSTAELKDGLRALNIKYKSQRQALFHLDKYELIKRAAIDLFIALGKNEEYSKNIGALAKQMAKQMTKEIEHSFYNDEGPLNFKSEAEKNTISNILQSRTQIVNSLSNF